MEVSPPGSHWGLQAPPGEVALPQASDKVLFLPRTWSRRKKGAKQSPRPKDPFHCHLEACRGDRLLRKPGGPQACPPRACQNPRIPLEGWAGAWTRTEQNFRNCWGLRFLRVRERRQTGVQVGRLLRLRDKRSPVVWGGRPLRVKTEIFFKIKEEVVLRACERRPLRAGQCRSFSLLEVEARSHQPARWLRERGLRSPRRKNSKEFQGTSAGLWENRCRSLGEGRAQAPGEGAPR